MSRYDLLEEMKNNMIRALKTNEIPTEINKKLQKYCETAKNIVAIYNENAENIFEYADEEFGQIDGMLTEINEEKTNEIFHGIMRKYRNLEENEEQNPSQIKKEFEEIICGKNQKNINKIIETMCDYIKRIEIKNTRILSARGYSDDVIYEQKEAFHELTKSLTSEKFVEDINEILGQSDKTLLGKIQQEYDEYQQTLEKNQQTETNEESINEKAKQFRQSQRYEEFSQEEQRKVSEKIIEEQKSEDENKKEDKGLDFLDDSLIV